MTCGVILAALPPGTRKGHALTILHDRTWPVVARHCPRAGPVLLCPALRLAWAVPAACVFATCACAGGGSGGSGEKSNFFTAGNPRFQGSCAPDAHPASSEAFYSGPRGKVAPPLPFPTGAPH